MAQIVDLQFAGVGLFLLDAPGVAAGLGLLVALLALLIEPSALAAPLGELRSAASLRRYQIANADDASSSVRSILCCRASVRPAGAPSARVPAALMQVGLDLLVACAQRGQTLLHLGQGDARRHGFLLALLPLRSCSRISRLASSRRL